MERLASTCPGGCLKLLWPALALQHCGRGPLRLRCQVDGRPRLFGQVRACSESEPRWFIFMTLQQSYSATRQAETHILKLHNSLFKTRHTTSSIYCNSNSHAFGQGIDRVLAFSCTHPHTRSEQYKTPHNYTCTTCRCLCAVGLHKCLDLSISKTFPGCLSARGRAQKRVWQSLTTDCRFILRACVFESHYKDWRVSPNMLFC